MIVIFIILIVFILGAIFLLKAYYQENFRNMENRQEAKKQINDKEEEIDILEKVKDAESFFTVTSCVTQYLDMLNENNDIYYGYDDNNNYKRIIDPYESIRGILSEKYIEENNLTEKNMKIDIPLLKNKVMFVPLQMRVMKNSNISKFLVYGIIENLDNEYISDIYLFVNLCETNHTFSIEPIQNKYNNLDDINYTNEEQFIEKNAFNEYISIEVNNEYICKQYLTIYKNIALAKPEIAYQFLQEDYKKKRFGDLSSYEKYLKDNKKELKILQLSQYQVNKYDEYTEYVCKSKDGNLFIFNENAIMDFTLKLDTYTISTDNFKKNYNVSNEQEKVMMNIDKWVQMLNNRDYTAAYNVLDQTFKNNTFGSEEDFEDYMRNNYSLFYKIKFSDFSEEGTIFVQHITLVDINSDSNEGKELEIIMKLEKDTDFVMSFSIES